MKRGTLLAALALAACSPDVGACDPEGPAFEVVYDGFGTPATAGQALMIQSCGGGGFCHADGIPEEDRRGVPSDLAFDLRLASTSPEPRDAQTARLSVHQARVARMRGAIWSEVESGRMPPPGLEGEGIVRDGEYERFEDDGVTSAPLPGLDTDEGRAILRDWLACGAPVVERTLPRADELAPVGFTVRACRRRCVDPTWDDLHAVLFEVPDAPDRGCAQGSCHDADGPSAGLDLSAGDGLVALRDRLVDATPQPVDTCAECLCGDPALPAFASMPMITPGDPMSSLIYRKVDPERSCGAAMPLAGNPLSEQARCALREWIACGAPASEDDVAAATDCLDAARAACGVEVETGGAPRCLEVDTCANRVDPERG